KNDGQLRLGCIEQRLERQPGGWDRWAPVILPMQPLAKVQDRFIASPLRRTQPVHLAYGDGVLVCPTNAGAVLGVDLLTQDLVWAYTYREGKPVQKPARFNPLAPEKFDFRPEWHN